MKALVQRVTSAKVTAEGKITGKIEKGFLVFLGVGKQDTEAEAIKLAEKISKLRIFSDENDKINLSLSQVGGDVLVVSQFTLYADCRQNRPSFINAGAPDEADRLYELFAGKLGELAGCKVAKGVFGADMQVSLVNDGPFTVMIECENGVIKG